MLDPAHVPDRRRASRAVARWEGQERAAPLARIYKLRHGGSDRPIIIRGSKHLRSKIVSRKTKHLQLTEGKGLRFLVNTCEVDPDVSSYEAHPFLVDVVLDGKLVGYRPDLVLVTRDLRVDLIEVKRTRADVRDPAYVRKLAAVAEVARRIGWHFRIIYSAEIFKTRHYRRNVAAFHSRRYLDVEAVVERRMAAIVHKGSDLAWAEASERLSPEDDLLGDALIECMIARGRFAVDFENPITPATVLTPLAVLPVGAAPFGI